MANWITQFIEQWGYAGVALLMLLENVFPPIPSELIMPFAGFAASKGTLHLVAVIAAGTAGSVAGATLWYALGRRIGLDRLKRLIARHGRWLTLTPQELQRAQDWFERHGHLAVGVGRLVPAIRSLVSVPAGVAQMGWGRFLAWTTAGSAVWTTLLTLAGFALGDRYEAATGAFNMAANAVFAALVAIYLWRVATYRSEKVKA